MRLNEGELEQVYRQGTSHSPARTECLTADEIARIATAEVNEGERPRISNHLMDCSDCTEEYRLISPLKSWAASAASGEAQPVARTTQSSPVALRLGTVHEARASWRRRFFAAPGPVSFAYAAAACLLAVSLALVMWSFSVRSQNQKTAARLDAEITRRDQQIASSNEALEQTRRQLEEANRRAEPQDSSERLKQYESEIAELRRDVDELSRPQLNTAIIDLEPQGATRGESAAKVKLIELPASANLFTLVLNVSGQPKASSYAVEITDQSKRVIWRGQGLRKSAYNTFTLSLSRRLLPSGRYHITLYTLGAKKDQVEDYAVAVQYK